MGKRLNPHPMQQIVRAENEIIRFRQNAIVRYLLDNGGIDLNQLAMMDFSQEDHMQFAQLIGYSVSGYGDLSYASRASIEEADRLADELHHAHHKVRQVPRRA